MSGIRIDNLPTAIQPSEDHEFPAMKDGLTVKLTIQQIYQVMVALGLVKDEDLGTAASRNVGTTAGTVAAGDDSRITGAVQTSRSVATQHSLAGGGNLSANRTLSLVNDTASPGNNKVYGTDASGVRGWKDDPAGAGAGSAKAWVNFNGTGTVAIRSAHNVSSITDNGSGDYTVNFASPMPNANYAIAGWARWYDSTNAHALVSAKSGSAKTTSAAQVIVANSTNGTLLIDSPEVSVVFFAS